MNVSQDLSILHLILNASAVVQAVMLLLAGVSFMSWYYIFRKWFTVKAARAQTEQFERDFWSGGDLNSLYQSAINDRHSTGSMERIFEAGFREFTKLRSQKNLDPKDVIDGLRRAIRAIYQRVLVETGQGDRLAALERHVQHRATLDGVRRLLEGAGFATVEVAEFDVSLRFADGSALLRHHFIRMGFLPGWAQVVPADRVPATFAALERALNAEAARRGELRLTIPAAGFVARRSAG